MGGAYAVDLSKEALNDVEEIVAWWRANRSAAPDRFKDELEFAVVRLAEQPGMGERVRFRRRTDVRRVTLMRTRYFVYYRLDTKRREVTVVHVRSTSRRRAHRRFDR